MTLEKSVYWKILRNQLTVTGTWNSSFTHDENDDWHYVINRLKAKRITPSDLITHRYSLENIDKGFEIMRDKREDYIKVMACHYAASIIL
jgi:L-iditol 2-dehydrogenase